MKIPKIIRNDFEIYPQKCGNDYTIEIDVEYDGIEFTYNTSLSLDYEELKRLYDYVTQQRASNLSEVSPDMCPVCGSKVNEREKYFGCTECDYFWKKY